MITENSIRISPAFMWHADRRSPRRTLASLSARRRSLKTGSLCLAQSSRHSSARSPCRERIRFSISKSLVRVEQGESAFPLKAGKCRGNRLAPAKRRVARIGGVAPRPEESLPRSPVPVVPLPWVPEHLCPRLSVYVTADSRQNSCAEFDAMISHSTR